MRRRTNPMAIIVLIAFVVGSIAAAILIKGMLPAEMEKWKSLIFWGIIAAGAGTGGFLCGKFLNRR